MRAIEGSKSSSSDTRWDAELGRVAITVFPEGDACVVAISGEIDLASRDSLMRWITAGDHRSMVVDLSTATFMDCSGYGGIVRSDRALRAAGRTLLVRGATGQPAHLLALIDRLDSPRVRHLPYSQNTGPP